MLYEEQGLSLTIPEAIKLEVGVCKQLPGVLVHSHGRGQDKSAHCLK